MNTTNNKLCEAQIHDHWNNKSKCLCPATKKITIETFVPHLNKVVKKVRKLCGKHSKPLLQRHRSKIKEGKKTTLTIEIIKKQT